MSETEIAPCSMCGHETKHAVLLTREKDEILDAGDLGGLIVTGSIEFSLLECCGCETICLRQTYNDHTAPDAIQEPRYFPPPLSRRRPKWMGLIPPKMSSLLSEVYTALASDGRRLAMMGARTVVDMIMTDKVGDIGSFQKKLERLESDGVISRTNRQYLASALDAGSAAAHRGHFPTAEAVDLVMDIIENLLEATYVLPSAAEQLKRETPPRKENP